MPSGECCPAMTVGCRTRAIAARHGMAGHVEGAMRAKTTAKHDDAYGMDVMVGGAAWPTWVRPETTLNGRINCRLSYIHQTLYLLYICDVSNSSPGNVLARSWFSQMTTNQIRSCPVTSSVNTVSQGDSCGFVCDSYKFRVSVGISSKTTAKIV